MSTIYETAAHRIREAAIVAVLQGLRPAYRFVLRRLLARCQPGGLVSGAVSVTATIPVGAGEVRSVGHGFVAGDVLYSSGAGTLAKAKADAIGTVADFVVVAVPSLDVVILAANGRHRVPGHGKTSGSTYYLDASTAGATTTTAPSTSTQFVQPIYVPVDADTLLVNVGNAIVVP